MRTRKPDFFIWGFYAEISSRKFASKYNFYTEFTPQLKNPKR